jgi:hypothetical protein
MPEQDADVFQVLIRQMREYREINSILGKPLGVLGHAELFEPVRNLLHCGVPRLPPPEFRASGSELSDKPQHITPLA